VIESKASVSGKHLLQLTAILPAIISVPLLNHPFAHELTPENPPGVWASPISLSILRI
jgi:hypothetical protein